MRALDTNVLVRYFAQDDPRPSALATDLLDTASLEVQDAPAVRAALLRYRRGGVDLHDGLIVAPAAVRKARVVTFDAKAARKLGIDLLR
jgi:predicted nucleic-acid-binding protein